VVNACLFLGALVLTKREFRSFPAKADPAPPPPK